MENNKIDINCDMGESYGQFKVGNDQAIFPYISSCNIACGFHGGDPLQIEQTIKGALEHNLRIGAHPSYPDLAGFGRRKMTLVAAELKATIKYQVAALKGMVESLGGQLSYVKPHGALYNEMAKNREEAIPVIEAILMIDPSLSLMGLAGSHLIEIAKEKQINFIAEAFGDRCYESNGQLVPRTEKGAVIYQPEQAVQQIVSIMRDQKIESADGFFIPIHAQSICIHGDNPAAVDILKKLKVSY
jgi:UPF0271 protein